MTEKDFIKALQTALNSRGEKLTVDGDLGSKTRAALLKYHIDISASLAPVIAPPPIAQGDFFGAPWIGIDIDLLGRDETDKEMNARFVPEWALEGLSGYKTLAGNRHAWCSLLVNHKLRKAGVKGTNSAGASSHSKWGKKSPFWFGATLDIQHKSGGRHVNFFLYWIDEKKKLAATMDGNRGNKYCVAITDLSGRGDKLVTGPRWSNDVADGREVSMAEVLAKYPFLKVGSVGGSTR